VTAAAVEIVKGAAMKLGKGVKASPVGLEFDDGLDFDAWSGFGERVGSIVGASAWWIGDWMVFGHWEYGKKYEEAIERTGLAYQTLVNLRNVAESVDFNRRRLDLSFSHHEAVAALEPIDQERLLERALREGLSVMALRDAVRGLRALPARTIAFPVRITIQIAEESRAQRWREAASASGHDFAEWAAEALDRAAA
jgi:hypothetical protein